jgi:hypothetical protein
LVVAGTIWCEIILGLPNDLFSRPRLWTNGDIHRNNLAGALEPGPDLAFRACPIFLLRRPVTPAPTLVQMLVRTTALIPVLALDRTVEGNGGCCGCRG